MFSYFMYPSGNRLTHRAKKTEESRSKPRKWYNIVNPVLKPGIRHLSKVKKIADRKKGVCWYLIHCGDGSACIESDRDGWNDYFLRCNKFFITAATTLLATYINIGLQA